VLSCGIICVILRLAVLIQYRSVTDTHRHTSMAYTVLSIALRDNNLIMPASDRSGFIQVGCSFQLPNQLHRSTELKATDCANVIMLQPFSLVLTFVSWHKGCITSFLSLIDQSRCHQWIIFPGNSVLSALILLLGRQEGSAVCTSYFLLKICMKRTMENWLTKG